MSDYIQYIVHVYKSIGSSKWEKGRYNCYMLYKRDSDKRHKSKIQEILVITEITSTYKDHERTNIWEGPLKEFVI